MAQEEARAVEIMREVRGYRSGQSEEAEGERRAMSDAITIFLSVCVGLFVSGTVVALLIIFKPF